MSNHANLEDELAANIGKARKQVTILFTDIVDSSRYWDQFGDVKGRMMVDRHNRLVFPVIKKFKGRVVKTIGDGLMVTFKRPNDALNAAIGIQQILRKMRDVDRSFHAKVRLGVHTGMAIVEQNDVFGDVVNVAKRVEGFGEANEIVLSSATAELLNDSKHAFHKKGSFIPKGKRLPMTVYRCRWNEYKDLSRGLKVSSDFPLDTREKGDIVAYSIIFFLTIAILYMTYLRYVLAGNAWAPDSVHARLLILNPLLVFNSYPFVLPLLITLVLSSVLVLIWLKTAPYILLRIQKGVMGFGLGFLLIYLPVNYFEVGFATGKGHEVYSTQEQFVRLRYKDAERLLEYPMAERNWYAFFGSDLIVPVSVKAGQRPLDPVKLRRTVKNPYAVKKIGVWTVKNLSANKPKLFYFRLMDLCAICLGVLGSVSGFMNFTIRPS